MQLTDAELAAKRFVIFIQGAFGSAVSAESICEDLANEPYCLGKSAALSVIDALVKAGKLQEVKGAEKAYFIADVVDD